METPIYDFVKNYAESEKIRFHMPGHKGTGLLGYEKTDITEIDGADVLYASDGIIRKSENNAAGIFGTARTVYSAEGSSLTIRAMLFLIRAYAKSEGRDFVIAAGRNAHKTFVTAAALLDAEVEWIFSEEENSMISCRITPGGLEDFFGKSASNPVAVYITSPDYLGNLADISALSKVCHRYGALLVVDNAHGAYLHFLPESLHPVYLGADMCCDSAHKTLPVLTGGAYLHISPGAPECFCDMAENAMAVFASTSPSYLILQSLDLANRCISENFKEKILFVSEKIGVLKEKLSKAGFKLAGNEPLKLTLMPKSIGYTGTELSGILQNENIICEFADSDHTVMMFSANTTPDSITKLEKALMKISPKKEITSAPPRPAQCLKALSLREALFSLAEEEDIAKCNGRILASPTVSCPPAIPVAVSGEMLNQDAIKCFEYYGIKKCSVVKINNEKQSSEREIL